MADISEGGDGRTNLERVDSTTPLNNVGKQVFLQTQYFYLQTTFSKLVEIPFQDIQML